MDDDPKLEDEPYDDTEEEELKLEDEPYEGAEDIALLKLDELKLLCKHVPSDCFVVPAGQSAICGAT